MGSHVTDNESVAELHLYGFTRSDKGEYSKIIQM